MSLIASKAKPISAPCKETYVSQFSMFTWRQSASTSYLNVGNVRRVFERSKDTEHSTFNPTDMISTAAAASRTIGAIVESGDIGVNTALAVVKLLESASFSGSYCKCTVSALTLFGVS